MAIVIDDHEIAMSIEKPPPEAYRPIRINAVEMIDALVLRNERTSGCNLVGQPRKGEHCHWSEPYGALAFKGQNWVQYGGAGSLAIQIEAEKALRSSGLNDRIAMSWISEFRTMGLINW